MNEVFLIGKINIDINFKFIVNSKINKSIAQFSIITRDKENIKIKAYNEIADLIYCNFDNGDYIFIYGSLEENFVCAKDVEKVIDTK